MIKFTSKIVLILIGTLISLQAWQSTFAGVITPSTSTTPIKAVAGNSSDKTQIVCNGTPATVNAIPQMSLYCISNNKVQLSEIYPIAVTGITIAINNGVNGIAWQLSPNGWQVAANDTILTGKF